MQANEPSAVATLGVALLFAAIFLFGGMATFSLRPGGPPAFPPFAAGVSVAYTSCTPCPASTPSGKYQATSPAGIRPLFPSSVYLSLCRRFLVDDALETVMAKAAARPGEKSERRRPCAAAGVGAPGGFSLSPGF